MTRIASHVFIALLILCHAPVQADSPASVPPPLSLQIAVPLNSAGTSRDIINYDARGAFPVVITNDSDQSLILFDEAFSWGHGNLSFRVTGPDGKERTVQREPRSYRKNFPKHFRLGPGEHALREVRFDDSTWNTFPRPEGTKTLDLKIQAVFEVRAEDVPKDIPAWTGRVTSTVRTFRIWS